MTQSAILTALAAASAAEADLRAQPETALLTELLARLKAEAFKTQMDEAIRIAGACPPSQVIQTVTSLIATWNAVVAQTEIRLATVIQQEAEPPPPPPPPPPPEE